VTGTIGISIANPTDVVKIRMQAQGRMPVEQRIYNGSVDCYRQTIAKDGISGLWVGWGANVMRNSVICAAKLASYD
jgi:solute carrier family 25 uncoupling protein 8/9